MGISIPRESNATNGTTGPTNRRSLGSTNLLCRNSDDESAARLWPNIYAFSLYASSGGIIFCANSANTPGTVSCRHVSLQSSSGLVPFNLWYSCGTTPSSSASETSFGIHRSISDSFPTDYSISECAAHRSVASKWLFIRIHDVYESVI